MCPCPCHRARIVSSTQLFLNPFPFQHPYLFCSRPLSPSILLNHFNSNPSPYLTYLNFLFFVSVGLFKIPVERIHEVEIPTGLPLVFNVRKKCIQVLEGEDWDDSSLESLDPLSRYSTPLLLCIALYCSALLCFALLCFALLCFALL